MLSESKPTVRGYRFGVFELDLKSGELRRQGRKVRLQDQPLAVLRLLLENAGQVITKEELQKAVWPANTFVDFDHGLHAAVTRVREALGDSAENPRFVETLPRRGYRFITSVEEIGATPAVSPQSVIAPKPAVENNRDRLPRRWLLPIVTGGAAIVLLLVIAVGLDIGGIRQRLAGSAARPIRSVAVLPLLNLSGDPAKEYLVDGVTDELITDLAQQLDLRVISRTSTMRYKGTTLPATQIGRELNVDALVEGSVALTDRHVRITAQLIDAHTDRHLWARSYEQSLDDILIAQSEMSRAIAREVSAKLSPKKLPAKMESADPQAHQAYLKGRYFLNRGDEASMRKAIELFREALERDPQDARSYAGIAECYLVLDDFYAAPMEAMTEAKAAASKALELDQNLGEAHTALGAVRFLYEWDWPGGEAELRRGIDLTPGGSDAHSWYALFLAHMGRDAEALPEIERAEEIDPLSAQVRVNAGWIHFLGHRNDRALAYWRETLQLEPEFALSHSSIWVAYLNGSSFDRLLEQSAREDPALDGAGTLRLAVLSGSYARSGNRAQAEAYLARLKNAESRHYVCAYELATGYAVLGDKDEAMNWLQKGYRDHSSCMSNLRTDPRLDSLHSDHRFQDLVHTLRLDS